MGSDGRKIRLGGQPRGGFQTEPLPARRVTLGKPDSVKADAAQATRPVFLAREKRGGGPVPLPASGPTLAKFFRRIRRAGLALVEAVRGEGDAKPSQQRHPVRSRLSPRREHRACRCRSLPPRIRCGKPGGANRSHDILRNLFDYAIAWGQRPEAADNPGKGNVRHRRPPRGRLLGAENLAKFGAVPRLRESGTLQ